MTKKILIDKAVVEKALEALELRCGTNAEERMAGGAITTLRDALNSKPLEPDAYNRRLQQQLEQEWCEVIKLRDSYKTTSTVHPTQQPVAWANPNDLQNFDMKVRTNGGPLHTVPLCLCNQASAKQDDTNSVVALNRARRSMSKVAYSTTETQQITSAAQALPDVAVMVGRKQEAKNTKGGKA